jgi:hypothetical protein
MIAAVVVCAAMASAGGGAGGDCDGVFAVVPTVQGAAVAVAVHAAEAMTGMRWYNNDEAVVFPTIEVFEASPAGGYCLGARLWEGHDVQGTSGWSELDFGEAISGVDERVYVVFHLPGDTPFTGRGLGGGPAIGYMSGDEQAAGYLVRDGRTLAILRGRPAVFMTALGDSGAGVMRARRLGTRERGQGGADVKTWPNPARGPMEVYYLAPVAGACDVSIYDIGGRLVKKLVSQSREPGGYTTTWDGRDESGRRMPAGVYHARLNFSGEVRTQRLVMLR